LASFFHHLQSMVGGRWLGWSVIVALGCTYAAALYLACVVERAFPGAVVLIVRRQASARDLLPWLAAARGAGFTKVGAFVKAPTLAVVSKTLGVLHKQRCCLAPFTLDDLAGTPLTRFDDWNGVVQATRACALRIALR
jgi:hypothetical protein